MLLKVLLMFQQSVNQAGGHLEEYKKNIESNFKSLKASLGTKGKDSVPKLQQEQKEWCVCVQQISCPVCLFPQQ